MKKILTLFCSLLFAVMLSEIILVCIDFEYSPLKIKWLGKKINGAMKTDWRKYHSQDDPYFKFDPELIWIPKKNFRIFNFQGFRGREIEVEKDINEYRIFAIGDSNTLGPSNSLGWVEYLGNLFQKKCENVIVINAGVWGYTSWQGLKRYERIIKYKPDMVLVCFGSNDALRVAISDKKYIRSKRFFNAWVSKFRLLQFIAKISDLFFLKDCKDIVWVPRVKLMDFKDNLDKMIGLSKKNDVTIVFLTRPFVGKPNDKLCWKNYAPKYNKMVEKISTTENVLFYDLYSFFKNKKEYFIDESHFNNKGHKIAAEILFNYLEKNIDFSSNHP